MTLRIKFRAGRSIVRKGLDPTIAGYTRQMRDQMKGVQDSLRQVIKAVGDQSPEILKEALRPAFDLSQVYVPVDTGDLKASGYLDVREVKPGFTAVEIGYGKFGKPNYAVEVHEIMEFHHAPPTQAKYLQRAIEEDFPNMQARIVEGYTLPNG